MGYRGNVRDEQGSARKLREGYAPDILVGYDIFRGEVAEPSRLPYPPGAVVARSPLRRATTASGDPPGESERAAINSRHGILIDKVPRNHYID
jgi:hypothetical protein